MAKWYPENWYWIAFCRGKRTNDPIGIVGRRNLFGYCFERKDIYEPIEDEL